MSSLLSNVRRANIAHCVLLICDIQDKFSPLIHRGATVITRATLLNDAAKVLNIPVVITEQYPKAFGSTVPELVVHPGSTQVFQKRRFSMLTDDVVPALDVWRPTSWSETPEQRYQYILCGVEAHVCVQQTVLDLLARRHSDNIGPGDVFLVCDAVSSQRPHDRAVALARMRDAGRCAILRCAIVLPLLIDHLILVTCFRCRVDNSGKLVVRPTTRR